MGCNPTVVATFILSLVLAYLLVRTTDQDRRKFMEIWTLEDWLPFDVVLHDTITVLPKRNVARRAGTVGLVQFASSVS